MGLRIKDITTLVQSVNDTDKLPISQGGSDAVAVTAAKLKEYTTGGLSTPTHIDTVKYDEELYIRCTKGLLKTNTSGEITNYKIGQIRYVRTYVWKNSVSKGWFHAKQSGWIFPCLMDNLSDPDQYNHCIKFTFTLCSSSPIPHSQDTTKDYFKVGIEGYNSVNSFYEAWKNWDGGREPHNEFSDDMYHPYDLHRRCAFVLLDSAGNILSNYAKFTLANYGSNANPSWTWARW